MMLISLSVYLPTSAVAVGDTCKGTGEGVEWKG